MGARPPRSDCGVARSLELLGDRWTLLVIRDVLVYGKRTFGEFAASAEGIPSNVLAERLARLVGAGLLERVPYQQRPLRHRYEPTPACEELRPVLRSLVEFGARQLGGRVPRGLPDRS